MDIFNIDGDIQKLKFENFQNIPIFWPIFQRNVRNLG